MNLGKIDLENLYKKDPYVYRNGTLINKLGITDYEELRQAEADISFVKLFTVDRDVIPGEFDTEYIQRLHKYILGDIFDWAGNFRTVPMEKPEKILAGDSVRYSHPNNIESDLDKYIQRLQKEYWSNKNIDEKVSTFNKLIAGLWQTHPFRDGNTRTIVAYAMRYAREKGFELNSDILLNNFAYLRGALVWASQGEYSNFSYLNRIVKDAILIQAQINKNNSDIEHT